MNYSTSGWSWLFDHIITKLLQSLHVPSTCILGTTARAITALQDLPGSSSQVFLEVLTHCSSCPVLHALYLHGSPALRNHCCSPTSSLTSLNHQDLGSSWNCESSAELVISCCAGTHHHIRLTAGQAVHLGYSELLDYDTKRSMCLLSLRLSLAHVLLFLLCFSSYYFLA